MDAVTERLNAAAEAEVPAGQARALLANLHIDALVVAQTQWFPNLFEEVEAYRDGEEVLTPEDEPELIEFSDEVLDQSSWAESGGWYTEDFALQYKLSGHRDGFMLPTKYK